MTQKPFPSLQHKLSGLIAATLCFVFTALAGCSSAGPANDSCRAVNGLAEVVDGVCRIACYDGYADCDGLGNNGCEISLQDDPMHCGDCDISCSFEAAEAQCSGGTCVLGACEANRADCNGQSDDGCEVDLLTDPFHCGECDHSCAGNRCVQGSCGDTVVHLFQGAALHFALDDTYAYLTYDHSSFDDLGAGTLYRVPKAGGESTVIADELDTPCSIQAEQGTAYWNSRGGEKELPGGGSVDVNQSVYRMTEGGTPEMLATSDISYYMDPFGKLVLGTSFLFAKGRNRLWRASRTGGTIEPFGPAVPETLPASMWKDLAVRDGFLYAVRMVPVPDTPVAEYQAEIIRIGISGGGEELLATASYGTPRHLAVTSDAIILVSSQSGAGGDVIGSVPLTGGTVETTLYEAAEGFIDAICADATHLYFPVRPFNSGPTLVSKLPIEGGVPEVIATANSYTRQIAVDDEAVYFLDGYGLWKTIK